MTEQYWRSEDCTFEMEVDPDVTLSIQDYSPF